MWPVPGVKLSLAKIFYSQRGDGIQLLPIKTLRGHKYAIESFKLLSDTNQIISISDIGRIKVWNLNGELIRDL